MLLKTIRIPSEASIKPPIVTVPAVAFGISKTWHIPCSPKTKCVNNDSDMEGVLGVDLLASKRSQVGYYCSDHALDARQSELRRDQERANA